MICQASYDSLEAIPEALREEFVQINGKWQLKETAIPGVGQLFNSALAANERKAVDQVKKRNEKIVELTEENNTLKDKLAVIDTPGSKQLSKEDAESFDKYTKLGTPKEIETKLTQYTELSEKVTKFETTETLSKIATATNGLNADVLSDWATSKEAEGLSFFVKSVEQTDAKGNKTTSDVPFVRIEKNEGGKIQVSERELLPFAKEMLPDWKYAALTTASTNGNGKANNAPVNTGVPNGVKLPDLGSSRNAPDKDSSKKKPIDIFNEQRDARPNPFAKPVTPIGSVPIVR